MASLLLRLLFLAGAVAHPGCGRSEPSCEQASEPEAADWCRLGVAAGHAGSNRLDLALAEAEAIQTPQIRAATYDRIFYARPDGLDELTVTRLCAGLASPYDVGCERSWARPHLWEGRP